MNSLNETAHKILDIAEHYTQTRGFNAFSYRDIQNDLGIKTSSIHYYFSTKQDLALAMVERFTERYQLSLIDISNLKINSLEKLQKLADVFIAASKSNKFCLCGVMAIDSATMDEPIQKRLKTFFQVSEDWIAKVIREGILTKNIHRSIHPDHEAAHYLAVLEGGLLIARVRNRSKYLAIVVKEFLARLSN